MYEREKQLMHNREPWWRAHRPAPTARQIAIAFLKYDVAPWMRSSVFPPYAKSTTAIVKHAFPAGILLCPCSFFLGVRDNAQPSFFGATTLRETSFFELSYVYECRFTAT